MRQHSSRLIIVIFTVFVLIIAVALMLVHSVAPDKSRDDFQSTQTEHAGTITDSFQKETTENNGIVVYIETGHGKGDDGKWDAGCSWNDGTETCEEATLMIPIARSMADYLQKSGFKVYTDAYEGNNLNLNETLRFLDSHEVDAFVNIHCDWEESEPGTMPLFRTDEQKELAQALNQGVHSEVDISDRGLTYRDDLDTLTSDQVHCPAVLFETGSIKADNDILKNQYDDYGRGLARGMCEYFEVPFMAE